MSILTNVYHITESTSAEYMTVLLTPMQKNFLFDIDILSELDNKNTDIFWNFGDPFSDSNEMVVPTIIDAVVTHVYTYAGWYNIHAIVTIDGVLFHIEKKLFIESDGGAPLFVLPDNSINYNAPIDISIKCYDNLATIYYKIDNGAFTEYLGSFEISANSTISYYATLNNNTDTETYSTPYNFDYVIPTLAISPNEGNYNQVQNVSISGSELGTIYYTLDGSTPTVSSAQYTEIIPIVNSTIVNAFMIDTAGNVSTTVSASYLIDSIPPVVTISPSAGSYINTNELSISISANELSTIYYTTNGVVPTISSPQYIGSFSVSAVNDDITNVTVNALAIDAFNNNTIATNTYTLIPPLLLVASPSGGEY